MPASGQSPIDIPPDAPVHRDGLELPYRPIPLVFGHHPTAIQVDCTRETTIALEGERFELVQFHLHCPSEHTFSGSHTAMELHLVHQSAEGRLAVVAVMFVEGVSNPSIERIVTALEGPDPSGEIELAGLLPHDRAYVAYDGSLTTPPFTEGVAWRVLIRPSTLAADQLRALEAIHRGNNRPVQPLNGRAFR